MYGSRYRNSLSTNVVVLRNQPVDRSEALRDLDQLHRSRPAPGPWAAGHWIMPIVTVSR